MRTAGEECTLLVAKASEFLLAWKSTVKWSNSLVIYMKWFTVLGWNPPKNYIPSLKLRYLLKMDGWKMMKSPFGTRSFRVYNFYNPKLNHSKNRQSTFHLSHSSTERCLWFWKLPKLLNHPFVTIVIMLIWKVVCLLFLKTISNFQTFTNCQKLFLWSYDKRRPTTDASSSTPHGEFRCHLRQSGGVLYDFACKYGCWNVCLRTTLNGQDGCIYMVEYK